MSDFVIEYFKNAGVKKFLTVRTPFVINDPDKIYYVENGSINLSSTKYEYGTTKGRLYNFLTFNQGELFLGFRQKNENDLVFLADAEEESTVFELSLSSLTEELQRNVNDYQILIGYLETWVIKIFEALYYNTTVKTPVIQTMLRGTGKVSIEGEQVVSTTEELIWIETGEINKFLFNCHIDILPDELLYFPVTKKSFLKTITPVEISIHNTRQIIADENFWKGIRLFRDLVLRSDMFEAGQKEIISENWLKKKYESIQREFSISISQAREILAKSGRGRLDAQIGISEFRLFNTCELVANELNIKLKLPPSLQTAPDPIDEICRHSGIRFREVLLEGEWYHNEGSGSLLGFLKDKNIPVAVISGRKGSYEAVDSENRESFRIDKTNFSRIGKIAYTFYKPLPNTRLRLSDLFRYSFFGSKKDFGRLALTACLTTILALVLPVLTSVLFDEIIPNSQRNQLWHIAYALLMATLGGVFFEASKNISILRLRGIINNNLQSAIWNRILDLPTEFFRKFTAGDLAERSIGVIQMTGIFSGVTINALVSGIFSIMNFILLFYFSYKLAFIALFLSLMLAFIMFLLGRKQVKLQKGMLEEDGKISGIILQLLTGISILKISGNEIKAFVQWFDRFIKSKDLSIRVAKVQNYQRIISSSFYIIALIFIYYNMIKMSTGMSTGKFLAFNAAYGAFILAMIELSDSVISALKTIPVYERMKPILEEIPENYGVKEAPGQLTGDIDISNITFRYQVDTPYILNDVSIRINKGEFIAFTGPSGSGKSTIIRLLLGFNKTEIGSIFYDGLDINNIDIKLLRKQIGVVLQDGSLIGGDIFTNIVGSSAGLTLQDAWDAAKAAAFNKDIEEMPMGMFTIISEEGGTLSGGQRQRLMIARALVTKPKILIFDEATSALDNRTQAVVTDSLNKLQVTRLVVAHRLSTVMNADKIIYLEEGKVLEYGNYQELMAMKGRFYSLAQRQIE